MLVWTYQPIPTVKIIPGFHGEVAIESPKIATKSSYIWGLKGNVTIIGKQTTRKVSCEIWLNDPSWEDAKDFFDGMTDLDILAGSYGDLAITDDTNNGVWKISHPQTLTSMLFLGYDLLNFNGQDIWSPIRDDAGCLYASSTIPGDRDKKTWAAKLRLNWSQTLPGRTVN